MARWQADRDVIPVHESWDYWRKRCFQDSKSLLTDRELWTAPNLADLLTRFTSKQISGNRDFIDKLSEQLKDAPAPTIQLAAEVIWFILLYISPSVTKPSTKREQIGTIWSWSGEALPKSKFLDDEHMIGVAHPGMAYKSYRPAEFEYLLRVFKKFKDATTAEQTRLLTDNVPWTFAKWLDAQEGSDRRLARSILLYSLFPDFFERITSREHREQIYETFKGKIDASKRIKKGTRAIIDYDQALLAIRTSLAAERGTQEMDFYQPDIRNQWFSKYREDVKKNFSSWLDGFLKDRGLRLNQSGRDTSIAKLREDAAISEETGHWSSDSGLNAS